MYGAWVKFYDTFMADVPYTKWLDFIQSNLPAGASGADLGCGTGKITLGLIGRGMTVYGVDNSQEMLQQAYQNAYEQGICAEFILGDINSCKFLKRLDFVTAMCDTFNYAKDLDKVFTSINRNLAPGGKLIFDISSEYKLKNVLGNNTFSDTKNDVTYVWENFLGKKKIYMELAFFEPVGKLFSKTVESQTQYIHSTADVILKLKKAGFSVKAYASASRAAVKPTSQRIFFVCQKLGVRK